MVHLAQEPLSHPKRVLLTEDMEAHAKEISKDKVKAKAFLVRAGLMQKNGKPTKAFR
ncbi:hypothetical protein QC823_10745 [Halomonas vilamensis]|uniref:Uncharacterized protein n=1 Tax=Vreelandella vilamensis TaxID=531309 RepID=A0ABU1H6H7_9GAMM|nr:hypothetical protein [Halomonas vilamensis]MDR5899466.1 hypothetical protein [Halomonas vilamensis]